MMSRSACFFAATRVRVRVRVRGQLLRSARNERARVMHAGWSVFLLLALVLLPAGSPTDAAAQQQRPNIVFLFSDDHAAHALSAYRAHLPYGARLPDTPHLDRL